MRFIRSGPTLFYIVLSVLAALTVAAALAVGTFSAPPPENVTKAQLADDVSRLRVHFEDLTRLPDANLPAWAASTTVFVKEARGRAQDTYPSSALVVAWDQVLTDLEAVEQIPPATPTTLAPPAADAPQTIPVQAPSISPFLQKRLELGVDADHLVSLVNSPAMTATTTSQPPA